MPHVGVARLSSPSPCRCGTPQLSNGRLSLALTPVKHRQGRRAVEFAKARADNLNGPQLLFQAMLIRDAVEQMAAIAKFQREEMLRQVDEKIKQMESIRKPRT